MSEQSAQRAELIRKATDSLKLKHIWLHASRFERPVPLPNGFQGQLKQQAKRGLTAKSGVASVEGKELRLLQVLVAMGTRVVGNADGDAEPPIHFVIEADFQVEYEMTADLPEEAITTFAQFNVVHNVWPFWRQHVFDIMQRGGLPQIEVPLFAGIKL